MSVAQWFTPPASYIPGKLHQADGIDESNSPKSKKAKYVEEWETLY